MKEFNHFEDGSAPFWNIWNLNSQIFVIQLVELNHTRKQYILFIAQLCVFKNIAITVAAASEQLTDTCSELSIKWSAVNAFLHATAKDMTLTSDPRCLSLMQMLIQSSSQVFDVYLLFSLLESFHI